MSSLSKTSSAKLDEARSKVLIIGAGITGLVLGQALKRHGIAFSIFERDPSISARAGGWGLTIHWALDTLLTLLPQHVVNRLPEAFVDPEASEKGVNGNFLFFDLRSGEARWKVPPNKRIRVSRQRLRALLLDGLDVQVSGIMSGKRGTYIWQWCKTLTSITTPDDDDSSVKAHFIDSSSAAGILLVGADGTHSRVRSALLSHDPHLAKNQEVPVRFLGARVVHPTEVALKMRALDPFFFQGGDPQSDVFMWFSFLDTPSNNSRRENRDTFECQIMIGWPYRKGFLGKDEPLDAPAGNGEKLALMKRIAQGWAEPFRECVMEIPEETNVQSIKIEDFVPRRGMWDNMHGRVTVIGDAAHAMTMCMSFFFSFLFFSVVFFFFFLFFLDFPFLFPFFISLFFPLLFSPTSTL